MCALPPQHLDVKPARCRSLRWGLHCKGRQDLKSLQQEHHREQRVHEQRLAALTEQNAGLQAAVRTAEQATARYEGRVAALETALKQGRAPQAVSKRVQFGAKAPAKRTRPRKD